MQGIDWYFAARSLTGILRQGIMSMLTEGQYALGGLAIFAIWVFFVLPFLYGPPPRFPETTRTAETHSEQSTQNTQPEPRGTTDAPYVVKVLPTLKTAEEFAQEAEDREEKRSADRWLVRWTAVLSLATMGLMLLTGILGYFAFKQSRDMRASIAAAHQAAEAANKSADASLLALRSWVSCEVQIISDLTYRPNGDPCITIQFTLENKGHSPAMGVRLHPWFHLLSPVHSHSIHAQQRIGDLLRELPDQDRGLLLFPGKTHIFDVELPISRIEIDKSIEDIKPKKTFFPELIVLVSYTYPLASHNPQTGHVYYLSKVVRDENYGFAFDLDEPFVKAENIALREHALWSEYAT
jgi:hypothetical protein